MAPQFFGYAIHQVIWPSAGTLIALWPNTRVVKCKYSVSQKQNGLNNNADWYNMLLTFIPYLTDTLLWTKISALSNLSNEKGLPGNTKKWTLVSSWTARVRLVHSWADG
jgi:hypothetical protein